MPESSGLRFDIYERVHLPEEVAAIGELEEVELVPHLKALAREEQVLLSGHLLLSGTYRPDAEGDSGHLEHWIPVEITLPRNRVERMEDLGIEIDNFDVDLLSPRILNVTGVLGLRGLQATVKEPPVWEDNGFTVVHQAPAVQPEEEDSYESPDYAAFASSSSVAESEPALRSDESQYASEQESSWHEEEQAAPSPFVAQEAAIPPYGYGARPNERDSSGQGYSQPGPVYLPSLQGIAEEGGDKQEIRSPVWYDQQRLAAEQARIASEQARSAAEQARAAEQIRAAEQAQAIEAERARVHARAQEEAWAREQEEAVRKQEYAIREQAERDLLYAREQAERDQRLAREQDEREEREAWEKLAAYQGLQDEADDAAGGSPYAREVSPYQALPQDPFAQDEMENLVDKALAHTPSGLDTSPSSYNPTAGGFAVNPSVPHEDKGEVKLALSAKSADSPSHVIGVNILSQLGDKGARREAELRAAEEAELALQQELQTKDSESTGDEIEWTRLFLTKDPGQSFRRVKLCIVQRADTLDDIATRYNIQTRELQLYNRMHDAHVSEGQVIHIP